MANGIQTNKIGAFRQDTVPFIDVQACCWTIQHQRCQILYRKGYHHTKTGEGRRFSYSVIEQIFAMKEVLTCSFSRKSFEARSQCCSYKLQPLGDVKCKWPDKIGLDRLSLSQQSPRYTGSRTQLTQRVLKQNFRKEKIHWTEKDACQNFFDCWTLNQLLSRGAFSVVSNPLVSHRHRRPPRLLRPLLGAKHDRQYGRAKLKRPS